LVSRAVIETPFALNQNTQSPVAPYEALALLRVGAGEMLRLDRLEEAAGEQSHSLGIAIGEGEAAQQGLQLLPYG